MSDKEFINQLTEYLNSLPEKNQEPWPEPTAPPPNLRELTNSLTMLSSYIGKQQQSIQHLDFKMKEIEQDNLSLLTNLTRQLQNPSVSLPAILIALHRIIQVNATNVKFEMVNLQELVNACCHTIFDEATSATTTIMPYHLPNIGADTHLMQILWQEILSNANKFRDPERPFRLQISVELLPEAWQFCVMDTGLGIPQDKLQTIFEAFTPVRTSSQHADGGIGLSLCKRIISQHFGKIWAESDLQQGTKFCFTIAKELAD